MLYILEEKFSVSGRRLNYLVHIDDKNKVVYIETPKVACTSIKKYMQDQYSGSKIELVAPSLVHDRARSPLKQISQLSEEEVYRALEGDYRRFSFVRNPFTRVLSGYLEKIVDNPIERRVHLEKLGLEYEGNISFAQFLEALASVEESNLDMHFSPQSSLLLMEHIEYDFIGAFERFEIDFSTLKSNFYSDDRADNYAGFGMHHATHASEKTMDFFSEHEIEIAQSIYSVDFDLFGYSTDIQKSGAPPLLSNFCGSH